MKKIKYVSNVIMFVSIIGSLCTALFVRASYSIAEINLTDYCVTSVLHENEMYNFLERNSISKFQDIVNQSDLVALVSYYGDCEVYKSNVKYYVKVDKIIKSNEDYSSRELTFWEYCVPNPEEKTLFTMYGSVPLIEGKKYLLLLNEQKNNSNSNAKTYYLTSESSFGKYVMDAKPYINEGIEIPSNELGFVSIIAENDNVVNMYNTFYDEAIALASNP